MAVTACRVPSSKIWEAPVRKVLSGRKWLTRLLLWWIVLFGLWLLFAGEWSRLIAVSGAGLALAAAVTAVVLAGPPPGARRRVGRARELPSAALATIVDFGILTWILVVALTHGTRHLGVFRTDDSTAGSGEDAVSGRVWVTLLASWSANSYVVDVDPATGRRLLHDLVPSRGSERPA